jgi:hypothetical protein
VILRKVVLWNNGRLSRLFLRERLSWRPIFADSAAKRGGSVMTIDITTLSPIVALVAGILILIAPRILNYVIAIYLIVAGITGLLPHIAH